MAEKSAPPPQQQQQWGPPPYNPQPTAANGWQAPPHQQQQGQVYPNLPPQNWPAPPAQQKAQVVYKPVSSSVLGNLINDVDKSLKGVGKSAGKMFDEVYSSQILNLFKTGSTIQLISKVTGFALTCYPNTGMDCKGQSGSQDPRTHFRVVNYGHNIVSLQNLGFPTIPNTYLVIAPNGYLYCTGAGDTTCRFRLHETRDHFITLESLTNADQHIAINPDGSIRPGMYSKEKTAEAHFAVHVIAQAPPTATSSAAGPPPPPPAH